MNGEAAVEAHRVVHQPKLGPVPAVDAADRPEVAGRRDGVAAAVGAAVEVPAAASYLNQLWLRSAGETGTDVAASGIQQATPAVTVGELRDQIAAWHPAAVLAVTSRDSALGGYLISALGPPAAVAGDVLGWRLGVS